MKSLLHGFQSQEDESKNECSVRCNCGCRDGIGYPDCFGHESDCVRPPNDKAQTQVRRAIRPTILRHSQALPLRSRSHRQHNRKIFSLDTFRSRRLRERPIRPSRCRKQLRNHHRRRRWNCLGHKVKGVRRLSTSRKPPSAEFRSRPLTTPDDGFRICASRISPSMKMESSGRFSVFSATSTRPQVSVS